MTRPIHTRTRYLLATAVIAVLVLAGSGCSSNDDAAGPATTTTPTTTSESQPTENPTPTPTAAPTTPPTSEPAPTPSTEPEESSDDHLDPTQIAEQIRANTEGDAEWAEVLSVLLAEGWIGGRYPGETDPYLTYEESWAETTAIANRDTLLELDAHYESPVPDLLSVELSRELGNLIELEAVVRQGESFVRFNDGALGNELPSGTARGLFTLGPTGPDGKWRIHQVIQLEVLE